jgi:hypothetical protein
MDMERECVCVALNKKNNLRACTHAAAAPINFLRCNKFAAIASMRMHLFRVYMGLTIAFCLQLKSAYEKSDSLNKLFRNVWIDGFK